MLLDSVLSYGFEDFGFEPYILSDDTEGYDQHDFPDVDQTNDRDEEKCILIANVNIYPQKNKNKVKFLFIFQIRKVFNCKQHV